MPSTNPSPNPKPNPINPPPYTSYVFSSRRYVVLANGSLSCYTSKEERAAGEQPRDQLQLTPEGQVVEMKAKGAFLRKGEGKRVKGERGDG